MTCAFFIDVGIVHGQGTTRMGRASPQADGQGDQSSQWAFGKISHEKFERVNG
jgi:hypothetical protein